MIPRKMVSNTSRHLNCNFEKRLLRANSLSINRIRGLDVSSGPMLPIGVLMQRRFLAATASSPATKLSALDELERENAAEDMNIPQLLVNLERASKWNGGLPGRVHDKTLRQPTLCKESFERYKEVLLEVKEQPHLLSPDVASELLSPEVVGQAFKALSKTDYKPKSMSIKVRSLERFVGELKQTELTDKLSLRLMAANSRAGNIGRTLQLLKLRGSRNYPPRNREFIYAIEALKSANYDNRISRNYFVGEGEQQASDNPTRWLDAILINMAERKYPLNCHIANRMLDTYTSGKTGKLVHHFYKVVRQPVNSLPEDERPSFTDAMPQDWFYVPPGESNQHGYQYQPLKVKLKYNTISPPFYKVPAQAKGKVFNSISDNEQGIFKLDRESEPDYSATLAAAFAFCDSLQHGACGHEPVKLNAGSYNALIKACVHRGALWRAMNVLDTVMPNSNRKPNNISFNLILAGLAAVGDVSTTQEYFRKMTNAGLKPDPFTVRAIVDGLLNLGDVAAAVTVVQDFFNAHNVLPPYTTHIRILEFCLGRDMIYEAKRYCFFIQQLWHWEPNDYHHPHFVMLMKATQRNTQLQKPALIKLFAYFGEELGDNDFI